MAKETWHFWYAWHPVCTRYHGWTWFRTVYRRQVRGPVFPSYGQDYWWEYDAVLEEDYYLGNPYRSSE